MLTTILLCLSCAPASAPLQAPATPTPLAASPVAAQDDGDEGDEIEDKRPEIAELVDAFKDHIGKRGEQDSEAVGIVDQFLQEWDQCGPKDRASIVKALSKAFDQKRRELEDGLPDNKLYLACATALGEMGEFATKDLQKWIGNKKHRKNIALQRRLILSLGKTKDTDAVKDLLDLLNDKDNAIIAAASQALGDFEEAEQKVRKDIFNDLLKLLTTTKALKDSDINDIVSRERYDAIAAPITTTLQALSGHDARKPEDWQRWWNKNKKKDWDEED